MIKLYEPRFGKEELNTVAEVLASGVLTSGPMVKRLEAEFADYVGSKYAVAVNSCTSALFLSIICARDTKRLEYALVPSCTFASVAHSVFHAGIPFTFEDKVYVGRQYSLHASNIVVDSAHELFRGCYKEGTLSCYSFYPTKLLGGAEGGMIATDDKAEAEWLRLARGNGLERSGMYDWDYTVEFPGWKMNMTDVQAAILLARLSRLDNMNMLRSEVVDAYNAAFGLRNRSVHVYPIQVTNRAELISALLSEGIQTSVHFKPLHLQPAYWNMEVGDMPVSESWGKSELSLPLHENLSHKDVEHIIKCVKKYATYRTFPI